MAHQLYDDHDKYGGGGTASRYAKLSMAQIAESFATCERDASMRSVSAVLRITREQIIARGHLGDFPKIGIAMAVVATLLGGLSIILPDRPQIFYSALGFTAVTVAVAWGVWSSRHERQTARVQEQRIRAMAADTLQQLLKHDFRRKPLLREQEQTLRELMRYEPRPGMETLLQAE